jgi:16S rRNA G527 N7-methylase RsmG
MDVGSGAGLPGVVLAVLRDAEAADADLEARVSQTSTPTGEYRPDESARRGHEEISTDPELGRRELRPSKGKDRRDSASSDDSDEDHEAETRLRDLHGSVEHEQRRGDAFGGAAVRRRAVVLIEPKARAVAFLRSVLAELGTGADVLAGRSEDIARSSLRESAATVTARAVAPPNVALELTLPLTAIGGRTLISSPTADEAGLGVAGRAAEELGGSAPVLVPLEVPGAEAPRWVIIVEKIRSTPERYPRRPASLRRRPLGGGRVN